MKGSVISLTGLQVELTTLTVGKLAEVARKSTTMLWENSKAERSFTHQSARLFVRAARNPIILKLRS